MTTIVVRDELVITRGEAFSKTLSPRSTMYGCARCGTAIYVASTAFPSTVILKSGTVDDTRVVVPRAHIWVRRKQAWLVLPEGVPTFAEQYDPETTWPAESLARMRAAGVRA